MPVLMVSRIDFLNGYYCIDISALKYTFPQIEEGKDLNIFLIEVRDEKNKIIKKFALFKEQLYMKILNIPGTELYYICLPTEISDKLGIGQYYKIVFIITKYDNKPFVSEYIKYIGNGSEKYQKLFKNIETMLLILLYYIDYNTLREAANYVLDAYIKLKKGNIEDSRTSLRKALETLEEIFNYEIKVSEIESKEYPKYICKLIKALKNFVNYGGPHKGPAPEHTTKFILYVTKKLIEHLSYSIYNKVISIDFNKPSNSNPCKENKKENQND
jgi:hypothetical protein